MLISTAGIDPSS